MINDNRCMVFKATTSIVDTTIKTTGLLASVINGGPGGQNVVARRTGIIGGRGKVVMEREGEGEMINIGGGIHLSVIPGGVTRTIGGIKVGENKNGGCTHNNRQVITISNIMDRLPTSFVDMTNTTTQEGTPTIPHPGSRLINTGNPAAHRLTGDRTVRRENV